MDSKAELRRNQRLVRRNAPAGEGLSAVLSGLLDGATRIASYVAMPREPAIPPRPGWLLPVLLSDGDLDWVEYTGQLRQQPRGLQEPVGPQLGFGAIASCDLVLVPALLVDRAGNRLGQGGGSYDRALARATGLTVALLHDGELVARLPREEHDVPVHAVATPSEGVVHLTQSWSV